MLEKKEKNFNEKKFGRESFDKNWKHFEKKLFASKTKVKVLEKSFVKTFTSKNWKKVKSDATPRAHRRRCRRRAPGGSTLPLPPASALATASPFLRECPGEGLCHHRGRRAPGVRVAVPRLPAAVPLVVEGRSSRSPARRKRERLPCLIQTKIKIERKRKGKWERGCCERR